MEVTEERKKEDVSDYDLLISWFVHNLSYAEIIAKHEGLTMAKVKNRVNRAHQKFLAKHGPKVAKLIKKMEIENGADSRQFNNGEEK